MANNATHQSTEPLPCSNVVPVLHYWSQVTCQVRASSEVVSCAGVGIAHGCRMRPLHVRLYLVLVLKRSSVCTYESSTSIYKLEGGAWTLHHQQKLGNIETTHSWWAYKSIQWILGGVAHARPATHAAPLAHAIVSTSFSSSLECEYAYARAFVSPVYAYAHALGNTHNVHAHSRNWLACHSHSFIKVPVSSTVHAHLHSSILHVHKYMYA